MPDTDLISFLKARLSEDEQTAQRVEADQAPNDLRVMATRDGSDPFLVINGSRVLREVQAKRRIIDREVEQARERWRRRADEHRLTFEEWIARWPPETLRLLALPHVHHKDFREEWRP